MYRFQVFSEIDHSDLDAVGITGEDRGSLLAAAQKIKLVTPAAAHSLLPRTMKITANRLLHSQHRQHRQHPQATSIVVATAAAATESCHHRCHTAIFHQPPPHCFTPREG